MLYIDCQYCITTVIYMSQKGLMQAGGVFRCPRGPSCCYAFVCLPVCLSIIYLSKSIQLINFIFDGNFPYAAGKK